MREKFEVLMNGTTEKMIERFFEARMESWRKEHGRRPESESEMMDALGIGRELYGILRERTKEK